MMTCITWKSNSVGQELIIAICGSILIAIYDLEFRFVCTTVWWQDHIGCIAY
jgi:hypothetical protein